MNSFSNISMKQKIISALFVISSIFTSMPPVSAQDDTNTRVHLPIAIAATAASNSNKGSVDRAATAAHEQPTPSDATDSADSKGATGAHQPYTPMVDGQVFAYTDMIILIDDKPATVAQLDEWLADHRLSAEKISAFIDGMEIPVEQAKATVSKGHVQIDGIAEVLNKAQKLWGVGLTVTSGEQSIALKWETPKGGEGGVRYDGLPDIGEYVIDGRNWGCRPITYFFQNGTDDIAGTDERNAVQEAFALWQAATHLQFVEVPTANLADIEILWGAGAHGDPFPFDGINGVLAHAFFPPPNSGTLAGDTHFDEDETWTLNTRPDSTQPIDLVTVAAHEIGHALGLGHSTVTGALMFPFYSGSHRTLHNDDIAGIQQIYGRCPVPYWQHQDDNAGGGSVGWWRIGAKDNYAIGDFDADGVDDLFSANPNGWSHLHHYDNAIGDFTNFYSNNGSGSIHWWHIGSADRYVAGDFDGDKRDELLAINPNGYAHLMQYNGGSWSSLWINGGNSAIHWWHIGGADRYVAGDFDGDKRDELLAINPNGYAHLMQYNGGSWSSPWVNGGNGAIHWWHIDSGDNYVGGDYNGDGTTELLAINPNGYAHLMQYNGGSWSSPWVNGGNGTIHWWSIGAPDRYVAGDFNADGKDELLAINPVNGWSQTMRFDASGWQWLAGNNGVGQMAYWIYGGNDWYLPGNFTGGIQDRLLNINPNGWWQLLRYQ